MFIVVYLETTEKRREANRHSEINIANVLAYCLVVCILCSIHMCVCT